MSNYHVSVLLQEAVDALNIQKGKRYIDATFGGGGHSIAIANAGGEVLGIDIDEDALNYFEKKLKTQNSKLKIKLAQGNFKNIDKIAYDNDFKTVEGILFDLGVSSYQLDTADRGFSFSKDAPLDMRMGKSLAVTAADLVNGLHKGELTELFLKLGEESFAKRIAQNIIKARGTKKIESTGELAEIVKRSYPRSKGKMHPATKVFQALRIAVNDELNSLQVSLPKALLLLGKKGRLAVITFHSLEDRIVKDAFEAFAKEQKGAIITSKPITPSDMEVLDNRRARSAKLRIFEKN